MAIGHGMQDAAKTMGIVVLALFTGGFAANKTDIPEWVVWRPRSCCGRDVRGRLADHPDAGPQDHRSGTAGGLRGRDRGQRRALLQRAGPARADLHHAHDHQRDRGRGATKRLSAVRWNVAGNIVLAWVTTFPAAALIACLTYFVVAPIFG